MNTDTKIGVIGDGGWGTALALLLAAKGCRVRLWGAFPSYLEEMRKTRENRKFLPDFRIPNHIHFESSLKKAVRDASYIILAVPSQYLRGVLKKLKREKWVDY